MRNGELARQFADALIGAHRTGIRTAAPQTIPDYETALAVQDLVQGDLGPVGGFKVGSRPDGRPAIAPIQQNRIFQSGADIQVRDRLGIELEVGFRVLRSPDEDMMTNPKKYFLPCAVLELVDTRLEGPNAESDLMKLADMQINAGLVVGSGPERWDGSDFGQVEAALEYGDTVLLNGRANVPGGSALANLDLLLDHLGTHCGGLRRGQILITGSVSGVDYFPAGRNVRGSIAGLGWVGCRLVS